VSWRAVEAALTHPRARRSAVLVAVLLDIAIAGFTGLADRIAADVLLDIG
jgi:hypothetical protein